MAQNGKKVKVVNKGGCGAAYFFGMVGALVYYLGQAHGFWPVIWAFLKSFVWPGFVVHDLLRFIH